jgi:voltage-gated potassium channel
MKNFERRRKRRGWPRAWRATTRDTSLLVREFRAPLLYFSAAILIAGTIYYFLAQRYHVPIESPAEAVYLVLTLTFLQSSGEFPNQPLLQMWYFIMPLVGVAILALGLTDFGVLLFNRRSRNKEWEMAVASTYNNHIVLVGLGHLGFRVAQQLNSMEEDVVVVEVRSSPQTAGATRALGIPVIEEDATREPALEAANIAQAKTIILCTQNDALNLQIALKARSMNPDIQVVIRIFDDDFASGLEHQFGYKALSGTAMAAPVFAAAAAGADVTNPISVEGQQLSLARLTIKPGSALVGQTVGTIEDTYRLNVVLLRHDHHSEMHPTDSTDIAASDTLAVLGGPEQLNRLVHDSG